MEYSMGKMDPCLQTLGFHGTNTLAYFSWAWVPICNFGHKSYYFSCHFHSGKGDLPLKLALKQLLDIKWRVPHGGQTISKILPSIRLTRGTNTLAYFSWALATKKKSLITLTLGGTCLRPIPWLLQMKCCMTQTWVSSPKLFTAVIYGFP